MAICIEGEIGFKDRNGTVQWVTVRDEFAELPSIYQGKVALAGLARDIAKDSLQGGSGLEFVGADYTVWEC